jgi:hypothetical protein
MAEVRSSFVPWSIHLDAMCPDKIDFTAHSEPQVFRVIKLLVDPNAGSPAACPFQRLV